MTNRYRKNAGIVLFNDKGKVLMCRRANDKKIDGWQFPQGGIENNESPTEAAKRELREETGVSSVVLVAKIDEPLRYDFPPETLTKLKKMGRNFVGQEQYWSLFFFIGDDNEINLNTMPEKPEFDQWEWTEIETAPKKVWYIKQEVYKKMVDQFVPQIAKWINKKGTN